MVLAQQKKLYEKDAILMGLEKKIVAVEVMKSVDDKSVIEKGQETPEENCCSKCNFRVFKTEKGLQRHIFSKHTSLGH